MRKKQIAGILLVVIIAAIGAWFVYVPPSWQRVIDRCIDYDPHWLGMVDCYGLISIWNNDNGKYDVAYNPKASLSIAEINKADDFQLVNGNMYVIDIRSPGVCNNLQPKKYCGEFRVNGESKQFYYDRPDQVPTYLLIDIKTGDERFYANLEDAPETDRMIFEGLLNRD